MRHGQSEGNLRRIFQGSLDYPLTDLGRAQAAVVGKWLAGRGMQFESIYSSPLARASETAGIIASETGVASVLLRPELQEINGGQLQGLTTDECNARYPDYESRGLPQGADFAEYGGETYEAVNARIAGFIAHMQSTHPEPAWTAVVAHGGSLYQLLKQWCGWPVPRHFFVAMSNCVMICLAQREIRGHLGAELKWMLPMELLDGQLTTDWRLADSPGGE
jgi:probable phosphoglycerate mutase